MRQISRRVSDLGDRAVAYWRPVVIAVAAVAVAVDVARVFGAAGTPALNVDAAVFEHGGWYISQGAVPYVDFWDTKPPLTYGLTAALAVATGRDPFALHSASVVVTGLFAVVTVWVTSELTHEVVRDRTAGLLAGLAVVSFAGFHYMVALGFRPKYPALALGGVGLLAALRGRSVAAGSLTAAAAGFMQHAAVLWFLAVGVSLTRGRVTASSVAPSTDRIRRLVGFLVGSVAVTLATVLPVVAVGGGSAMVTEVILAQLSTSEPTTVAILLLNGYKAVIQTKFALVVFLLGGVGTLARLRATAPTPWWQVAGLLVYGTLLLSDWDGYDDLFFVLVFAAVGLGLLVAQSTGTVRKALVVIVAVTTVVSVLALGGTGVVYSPQDVDRAETGDTLVKHVFDAFKSTALGGEAPGGGSGSNLAEPRVVSPYYSPSRQTAVMRRLFWSRVEPTACHYRFSAAEIQWLELTDRSPTTETCGALPGRYGALVG